MAPPKKDWDEESSDDSSEVSDSPNYAAAAPRRKFDDEEGEDSDVLDSWDAAEDSEVEREKARKAAEAKAKVEAEAKANKKSKTERIAMHQAERKAAKEAAEAESSDDDDDDDETEEQKRRRLRAAQKEADLRHAEDLFGDVGNVSSRRTNTALAAAVVVDPSNPNATVDLGSLPLFNPKTKTQLEHLGKTIAPLLAQHHKMPAYVPFFQEICKVMAKELPSEQVKKIASTLTAVSNEKMRSEKASEKTGKKKGKAKTSLVTTRNNVEDVAAYNNEAFGDDDFM